MPPADGLGWFTNAEAAAWLDVDPRTIARWAEAGRLPNTRTSTWRRYSRRDLERLVEQRVVTS